MLQRHHEVRFATGAVVFPGGKLEEGDRSPALRALCSGCEGLDGEAVALRAAAIRETFEESGVLLARTRGSDALLGPDHAEALIKARSTLHSQPLGFAELLVPFAHWITPPVSPKRFDTHFFVAAAPVQEALHDGS